MLFKKNEDIEFNEYEEYSEEYEKIVFDTKEKKFRKISSGIFIAIVIILAMITIDVICVSRYNKGPFFAIKTTTYEDGGTNTYYGIGYKVIKYNQTKGRKDTQIGFWNMKYCVEPTSIDVVDLAIEFQDLKEETSKKYYKQFLKLTGTIKDIDKTNNEIIIEYNDPSEKYTLNVICSLVENNNEFEIGKKTTVIGTLEQFEYKTDKMPNRAYMSNCFVE